MSWVEDDNLSLFRVGPQGELSIYNTNSGESEYVENVFALDQADQIWKFIKGILSTYKWGSSATTAHGLLELDYFIVRRLLDKNPEGLDQKQLSLYNAAMKWKKPKYLQFVPPKPEVKQLSENNYTVAESSIIGTTGKPKLTMIIIGNVDSGKSTTSGRLILACGAIDERTIEKYHEQARSIGNESSALAWVMDKRKEERERRLTIDLSWWYITTETYGVDIVDAPGHNAFMKNMAKGACFADAAILVVSASVGEFEAGVSSGPAGMTKQELIIAYTNGVRFFIILVNKMDTVDYSEERFNEVTSEMSRLIAKVTGNKRKILCIPASSLADDNISTVSDNMPWYQGWQFYGKEGYTLIEAIDAIPQPARSVDGPLRIPLIEAHKISGVGTVVVGRVASGTLKANSKVYLAPDDKEYTIRSIETYHDSRTHIVPGDTIGIQVSNMPISHFTRGMVMTGINDPIPSVRTAIVQMKMLSIPNQWRVGATPFFFFHTASVTCKIIRLIKAGDEENPDYISSNQNAVVEIEPARPVAIEPYVNMPPLGRFSVRINSKIVAVGVVKSVSAAGSYTAQTGRRRRRR
eukprot:TRINITY_DN6477_c0_g5_i1.p1 TRINITY_DN6477_c0_g5~~TRINITY_DN6477_c0_g5_i1.p1  ORF type:complete len:603 (-),score=129.83 TRINITY_DN6477_c0_g5_i1:32-1768(-)